MKKLHANYRYTTFPFKAQIYESLRSKSCLRAVSEGVQSLIGLL